MRIQRRSIVAASLILLTLVGIAGALARRQAAQDGKGVPPQPRTVMIEKDLIVGSPPMPAAPATTARASELAGDHDAGLPRSFVFAASSFERRLVTGAPLTAELVIETVEPRRGGELAARRLTSFIYRDGEGRTRRDRLDEHSASQTAQGRQPRLSFIHDHVAGSTYVLEHRAGVARRMPLQAARESDSEGLSPTGEGTASADGGASFKTLDPRRMSRDARGATTGAAAEVKRESLGRREIEGLTVEGTRLTRVVPAGAVGNGGTIEVVAERWYSSELQAVVLIKRHDPRYGESVYRLTNISRSEPARTLFAPPGGYKIRD